MPYVSFATDGAVCTITLNRPDKRNAVHGPMAAEIRAAFIRFEENAALRVAIITGAGGHFESFGPFSRIQTQERP